MVLRKRLAVDGPALFFVTTTIRNWAPAFSIQAARQTILDELRTSSDFYKADIAGFVIMPSHVHLLIGLSESTTLSRFVQQLKSVSSRRILPILPVEFLPLLGDQDRPSLWMPRFDDVLIVSQKQFRVKLEYIHNNPVKAGLVTNPQDYKWSSAGDWLTEHAGEIRVCKEFDWTRKV